MAKLARHLFLCALISLSLPALAETAAKKPATQPTKPVAQPQKPATQPAKPVAQPQKPAPAPTPTPVKPATPVQTPVASNTAVCFCADNETNLQGCAVDAVRVSQDRNGDPVPLCLDPQASLRPVAQIPAYDAPEFCNLEDVHTGEIRPGHVQCIQTGTVVCK